MMQLDQLIAKLRASIPATPNAVFCRPLRVADALAIIAHLERLKALDAVAVALLEVLETVPERAVPGDTGELAPTAR